MSGTALWVSFVGITIIIGSGLGIAVAAVHGGEQPATATVASVATMTPAVTPQAEAAGPPQSPTIAPTAPPSTPTPVPPPATATSVPPTPTPVGPHATVRGTGTSGLIIRDAPGGARIASTNEGETIADLGAQAESGGRRWQRIRVPDGTEGWAAAEFLAGPLGPLAPPMAAVVASSTATSQAVAGGTLCNDGWVSPSTGSGTCSSHGGIADGNGRPSSSSSSAWTSSSVRSCYGCISPTTGRPQTVRMDGYTRRYVTYVQPHYRSATRRR